jgi:hypothetical protein
MKMESVSARALIFGRNAKKQGVALRGNLAREFSL